MGNHNITKGQDRPSGMPGEVSLARKTGRLGRLLHRYYSLSAHRDGAAGDPLRGQGRVLALLVAKPMTTQRDLSYLLDMRQQSLSELLAKLEEKGYVTREKSAEDGRVTVVSLTDAGAEAAPKTEEMGREADALDCLSEGERAQFEQLVDKVTASLEERLVALGDSPGAHAHRPCGPYGGRGHHGRHDPCCGHGRHGERGVSPERGDTDDRRQCGNRGPHGNRCERRGGGRGRHGHCDRPGNGDHQHRGDGHSHQGRRGDEGEGMGPSHA